MVETEEHGVGLQQLQPGNPFRLGVRQGWLRPPDSPQIVVEAPGAVLVVQLIRFSSAVWNWFLASSHSPRSR